MQTLYFGLAALHMVAVVVTGILWILLDLGYVPSLRPHLRDIRAVHFGSLYLVPWFLGLVYAFDKLQVPIRHQAFFPAGLGALLFFAGLAYLFPRPPGLDPFYYWTLGWPMVLSLVGLACLVVALLWTAAVLVAYAPGGQAEGRTKTVDRYGNACPNNTRRERSLQECPPGFLSPDIRLPSFASGT
jgi:hypothetical protein